ncbi:MAG: hypothetical protein JXR96_16080 [Deltaproteobacteria bacterium]|nr:hypothetical protein [Deltaproteobacteria bacterium]
MSTRSGIPGQESQKAERKLEELSFLLGELSIHFGGIARFFQSKLGHKAVNRVLSPRALLLQGEIEEALIAIGSEVVHGARGDEEAIAVTSRMKTLLSRIRVLKEMRDELVDHPLEGEVELDGCDGLRVASHADVG